MRPTILLCSQHQVVVAEVARAEKPVGLAHKFAVGLDHLGLRVEVGRIVGEELQHHRPRRALGVERHGLVVTAGEERRVDQHLERHLVEGERAGAGQRAQRCCRLEAGGQPDGWLHADCRQPMPRRIQQQRRPVEVDEVAAHRVAAAGAAYRREVLEVDLERARVLGHFDVQRLDLDRVALPRQAAIAGADHEAGDLRHVAERSMGTGNPARDQQRQRTGRHRQRLVHAHDAVIEVGGVDRKGYRAGIGLVLGLGQYSQRRAAGDPQARDRDPFHPRTIRDAARAWQALRNARLGAAVEVPRSKSACG